MKLGYGLDESEIRLLVDIRYRAPLSGALLAGMIPEGESWVLGPPHVGHWRLSLQGEPVEVVTTGRHDPCVGVRAGVTLESRLAIELMNAVLMHQAQFVDKQNFKLF